MTDKSPTELERHEATIHKAQSDVVGARLKAAKALLAIYENDLYLERHFSFEHYLEDRWGFKRAYGHALLDTARMAAVLDSGTPAIPDEYQLRQLKKVKLFDATDQDEWRKRGNAWEAVATEIGTDIEPDVLHNYLLQNQWITPRSKKNQITPEQRQDRLEEAELRQINKALEILANASFHRVYAVKRWGRAKMPDLTKASKFFD